MRDFSLAKISVFFVACMDAGKVREQEAESFEYFAITFNIRLKSAYFGMQDVG